MLITKPRNGEQPAGTKGVGVSLNFNMLEHFNGDMDVFARHVRERGANVLGPINQPWNVREVTVYDPDGYILIFSMPINRNLSFDEVIDRMKSEGSKE